MMKWHERVAIFAAVASLAGMMVFSRRLSESERKAMQAGNDLSRTSQDLRKKLTEAERRADDAARKLRLAETLKTETAPAVEAGAPPSTPTPAPSQEPVPVAATGGSGAIVDRLCAFGAMTSAAPKGQRGYLEAVYEYRDLLISWGLTGETLETALNAVLDRAMAGRGYLPPESRRTTDEALARLLTPQQLEALRQHEQALPDRLIRKRVDRQLSGMRVDPARAPALRDILIEENVREIEAPLYGTVQPTVEQLATMLAAKRESNERILQRARPLLADQEYESLRRWTERQAWAFESSLEIETAVRQGIEAR